MSVVQKIIRYVPGVLGFCLLLTSTPNSVWGASTSAVIYKVEFKGKWSATTHPTNFPQKAHFSPLIGGVHNDKASFWMSGKMASPGLEAVAETGKPDTLKGEVGEELGMGNVGSIIQHSLPPWMDKVPEGGLISDTFNISVSSAFPLVTLVTMVAPSPDWFVGVSGLNLMDADGNWRSEHTVDLFPYDAGTEDGEMFSTENAETMPKGNIMSLKGTAPFSDQPIATLTFTRAGEEELQAHLEQPMEGQVAAGVGLIRGWAFGSRSAVDSIELFVDGKSMGMVSVGSMRGDVGANFPSNTYASESGFGLPMNYGTLDPGEHTLTILGTSDEGSTFTINRKIMVKKLGGFEFVDADLSTATVSLESGKVIINGVKITKATDSTMMQTQKISLMWSKSDQGFMVSDIMGAE